MNIKIMQQLMRYSILITALLVSAVSFGQLQKFTGTYRSTFSITNVRFNEDSTFEYVTEEHPTFYRWEDFSEKGKWAVAGDTVILNPNLSKKIFVEFEFKEGVKEDSTNLLLTFNHIKRYFDADGNIANADTLQIQQLDYSFNNLKKKNHTRVTKYRSTRCAYAGYIPQEIITTNHTISITKPVENIHSIFIGCNEMQQTKEFIVKNKNTNHFTLTVYSNYYLDGQIRQLKYLIKNDKILYTKQNGSGRFKKETFWSQTYSRLKKQNQTIK